MAERLAFQAEVQQLLKLMIHSVYSNKEIFLRELISNSSDALDKLNYEIAQNPALAPAELAVHVKADKNSKTIVIEDNGIGMNREELIQNIGTIASSGTRRFLEQLTAEQKKERNLIGQFGVGFYAAFMIANNVVVETKKTGDSESWIWESTGDGSFSIDKGNRITAGTTITLHVKDEEVEFLENWRLQGIIKKYSDYVTYPIYLFDEKEEKKRVNSSIPVWIKNKKDNSAADYHELYKQLSGDFKEPLSYEHIQVEGNINFQSIVFLPSETPFDLHQRDGYGLHLYVKRVCISEQCKDLLPEYLRFVKGVVETEDLPLNMSRELLQQNKIIPVIKKNIVRKTLAHIESHIKNKPEDFYKFYTHFGAVLKEGFHFDRDNHEMLSKIVRFKSNKTGLDGWVSFAEYWERKALNQKEIYFITAPSYDVALRSPHLEAFAARGIEVLFLVDPIDEWLVMDYPKHDGIDLKSVLKGDFDLRDVGDSQKEDDAQTPDVPEMGSFVTQVRDYLAEHIKDVKVSKRLKESPCCLVTDEHGMSSHMERLIRASNKDFKGDKKILEVNPSHPLIQRIVKLSDEKDSKVHVKEWFDILYDTALLAEGSAVRNPGDYARKVTQLLSQPQL